MDSLQILRQNQERELQSCVDVINHFERIKSDYEALKQRLATIADKTKHEIMAPIVSTTTKRPPVALMPGYLQHTNEILVLLGDDWFVETSAKHSVEIVERRIAKCDEMLKKFGEEKAQIENWMKFTHQLATEKQSEGLVEIVEDYDDQKEKEWREKHRESVRKQKQEESKNRQPRDMHKDDFDELFARLELEEMEAEMQAGSKSENKPSQLKSILKSRGSLSGAKKSVTLSTAEHSESIPKSTDSVIPVQKLDRAVRQQETLDLKKSTKVEIKASPVADVVVERDLSGASSSQQTSESPEPKRKSKFKARR